MPGTRKVLGTGPVLTRYLDDRNIFNTFNSSYKFDKGKLNYTPAERVNNDHKYIILRSDKQSGNRTTKSFPKCTEMYRDVPRCTEM